MTGESISAQIQIANIHMALELGLITRDDVSPVELELVDSLRVTLGWEPSE